LKKGTVKREAQEADQSFRERLRQAVDAAGGVDAVAHAAYPNLSRAILYNYLARKAAPSLEKLVALSKALMVCSGWLASGEQNDSKSKSGQKEVRAEGG
jgi:hypothetical protein